MKYSIRDLLLVTVIVALAVGWWVERQTRLEFEKRVSELEKQVSELRPLAEAKTRTVEKWLNLLNDSDQRMKQLSPPPPPPNRIDSEVFKKLADEAREKYGVP
jgi:hypothetical protein